MLMYFSDSEKIGIWIWQKILLETWPCRSVQERTLKLFCRSVPVPEFFESTTLREWSEGNDMRASERSCAYPNLPKLSAHTHLLPCLSQSNWNNLGSKRRAESNRWIGTIFENRFWHMLAIVTVAEQKHLGDKTRTRREANAADGWQHLLYFAVWHTCHHDCRRAVEKLKWSEEWCTEWPAHTASITLHQRYDKLCARSADMTANQAHSQSRAHTIRERAGYQVHEDTSMCMRQTEEFSRRNKGYVRNSQTLISWAFLCSQ